MFKKINNVTVIAPHPDDELMGCLTLFQLCKVNKLIVVTNGNIQTIRKTLNNRKYVQKRKQETIKFAIHFGLKKKNIMFLNFRDEKLYTQDNVFLTRKIKQCLINKEILFIPSGNDQHLDHQAIFQASRKINNKKILYSVTDDLIQSKKIRISLLEKQRLLKKFYPSQYWRLFKSNFPFRDYEQYKFEFTI